MVVMRSKYCTLVAYQLFTCLAKVDEGTLVVNAVTNLLNIYAGAGGVGAIEDIYEAALDPLSFLVGVFESLGLLLDASLPLDLDLEADFYDF